MSDPCDFCDCADVDHDPHTLDCPNNDATADVYYGFIQAICWVTGADGQNFTTFNEPDELWVPSAAENIKFSRAAFLRHFAEWDNGSPVMMMKPLEHEGRSLGAWVIFCTESDDALDHTEADLQGFAYAAEWADRG